MGILRRLLGIPSPVEVMRLDIYMEYSPLLAHGSAAVQWVPLASDDVNLRPFLVALLYARILGAHAETRSQLFSTIDELSTMNVRDEGRTGFPFKDWTLEVGMGVPPQTIWPWSLYDSPNALGRPKVYQAALLAFQPPGTAGYFGINLKMALGQERILAPSSVLIAITALSQSTDQEGRYELAVFYGR
jgi:hypothetical protein